MRTPRCRTAGLLLFLLVASPGFGSPDPDSDRGSFLGYARGLATAITGIVLDERNQPVAEAEVEATVSNPPWGPDRQRTRTDAAGRFSIPEVPEGWYHSLRVSRAGYAPTLLGIIPQAASEYRFTLHPGATVSGRVVDEAGRAVQGARIDLFPKGGLDGEQDLRLYRAISRADGGFEIRDLPAERFELRVAHRDHFLLIRETLTPPGPARVDLGRLSLTSGKRLAGKLLDSKKHPLAGFSIWSGDPDDPGLEWYGDDDPRLAPVGVTAPDGSFSIPRTAARQALFFCSPDSERHAVQVPDGASEIPPFLLDLSPPSPRISGRILDESGKPVRGARVRPGTTGGFTPRSWYPCEEDLRDGTVTDKAGRFSLRLDALETPNGTTLDLWAEAPGYLREVRTAGDLSLRQSVEIVLSRGTTVSGQIFAPDGSPAAGARVYAGIPAYEEMNAGRAPETRTDAQGRYRLTGVRPGWRELWAEHPELGEARRRIELSAGVTRIDLTLDGQRERTVAGFVTGPGGEPLERVRVKASYFTTYTRDDGSFRLVFPRGTLLYFDEPTPLGFTKPGYVSAVHPLQTAEIPIDGLEVRLEKGWPLTGSLLGVESEDLPDVEVEARRNGGEAHPGKVNPDGTYGIEDLEPGTWTVRASLDYRVARGTVEVAEGGAGLDLRLPDLQEVRGRVLDGNSDPVRFAEVTFQALAAEGDSSPRSLFALDDGTFSIQLAEGTYHVQASRSEWGPVSLEKPLTVESHPIDDLEIRMRPGAVLRGKILDMPVSGSKGALVAIEPSAFGGVSPEADGSYRLPDVGPGEWGIEARVYLGEDVRIAKTRITVAPGETEKVLDLDLSLGNLTLSGLLTSGDEPLSANVALLKPDGESLLEQEIWLNDHQGKTFRFLALRPGTYTLRIKDYNRDRTVLKPIELSSDQTVTIDLLNP